MKNTKNHDIRARQLWDSFTENERHGVRFGMFPHDKTTAAEREGFDGHKLVVALMKIASENGGMRA